MNLKTTKLREAIGFALAVGAASAAGTGLAFAQESTNEAKTLDAIQVTGSRVARVETETASPVVVIDRAAIEQTGKLTLGDLIQEMPSMSGAPTNPQVNNGGGDGSSTIDLRGLGSERTLLLVNGRRVVNADVNSVPASAVERIEILTSGASAVYGSDAIAGVVNFILRKDFEGLTASIDFGITPSHQDGQRSGGSITFGQVGDKGNIIAGLNYNKFDGISSADRDFSKDATYLYSGAISVLGSSRNPNGRIYFPAGSPLRTQYGCNSVTLRSGATGGAQGDYRCYDGSTDSYNYQATNLIMTPQERTNAFFLANYQITDNLNAFAEVYHNKTSSNFAIAALPFDANNDGVVISADNYYNPFGQDFGPVSELNSNQFLTRFTSLGQRRSYYDTTTSQVVAGLEGFVGESWKWDAVFNYGHYFSENTSYGYVIYNRLRDALGPSFMDTDGVVKCGASGAVIADCVPLNIFNTYDPQTIATLSQYEARPHYSTMRQSRSFEANANGELFDLPAGAVQLAVGAAYREEYQRSEVDYVALADDTGRCDISQEACGSALSGKYDVTEVYGELYVPILADAPFAHLLSVTLGSRYSDYSLFGDSTNSKIQVEWRPIENLLLRGTVAEVFRVPRIQDIYAGPQGDSPQLRDLCIGYLPTDTNHNNACGPGSGAINIPAGGIEEPPTAQSNGIWSGSQLVGVELVPEEGKSFSFGVVYDPQWAPGLSVSLDYWRMYLNNMITRADAQTVLDVCYAVDSHPFCDWINRNADGQVNYIREPMVNLGRLDANGWDLAVRYRLPDTAWGNWLFGLDATYINRYDNDAITGTDIDAVQHVAGTYNPSYGMFARTRGRVFVNWSKGDLGLSWRARYVSGFDIGSNDLRQGNSADGGCNAETAPEYCYARRFDDYMVHSFSAAYSLPWFNSKIEVGLDNAFDKQPQMLFQNNVLNANTDVQTYDTVGRYLWARYTMNF